MSTTPEAIAAALRDLVTNSSLGFQAVESLTDNFTPPAVLVAINKSDFHVSNAGGTLHQFIVHAVLAREPLPERLKDLMKLMAYAGTGSMRKVLETDGQNTLGGIADDLQVTEAGPPVVIEVGNSGVAYIDCPFTVDVYATG